MKLKIVELNSQANRLVAGIDRNCVLGAAIGLVASQLAPLPTSDVSDPQSHYALFVTPLVNQIIGEFNEVLIMDAKFGKLVAEQLWQIRFLAANPLSKQFLVPTYGFIDTIVGAGNFVDPETHEFLNRYKNEILALAQLAQGEAKLILAGDN